MFIYQLEHKDQDKTFLSGDSIQCKAVVPVAILNQLEAGCRIVVQLSNKSKYMGIIQRCELKEKKNHAEGYLLIKRS